MRSALSPRLLAVALLCVPIAACSVANYRKPVEDFAQATKETTDALTALDKQVTDGYADLLRKRVLNRTYVARIKVEEVTEKGEVKKKTDCLTESERCRIVLIDTANPGAEKLFPPESPMQRMLILMGLIRGYADGLVGIVTADTAAQVSTEVSATVGSVKNLAVSIAKLKGPDNTGTVKLGDYATPVGNLVNWLAGQYIASVQLDGLRRATVDARPVIAGAADVLALAVNEASLVPRALMAEEVSLGFDTLRGSLSERNLDEVVARATRYDVLLRSKPPDVFKKLRDSHEALVQKIQDENITLAEVIARIEEFAIQAQALAAIVKDLQAVGKKKAEG